MPAVSWMMPTITEDNPRYRFPGKRERDGKLFEFRKTLFLYNGFRIKAPVDDLIVVEGFTGVWWLASKRAAERGGNDGGGLFGKAG